MGKRKLRSCTNCGGRHGPPTGKNCAHGGRPSGEEIEKCAEKVSPCPSEAGAMAADFACEFAGDDEMCLDPQAQLHEAEYQCGSPAGSGANGASFLRLQRQIQEDQKKFEKSMSDRMGRFENVLGRVAGVQQAQLERLVHLANHPVDIIPSAAKSASTEPQRPASPKPTVAAPPPPLAEKQGAPTLSGHKWAEDFAVAEAMFGADVDDNEIDADWRDYQGVALWMKEKEKKIKNPFDQRAFTRKGEKVSSFESLMYVTFKTALKLMELKYDARGILKHGMAMAEKAAKNVYEVDAFLQYDESVRERAGQTGPSAFGTVVQEDVLMHYCFDNTIKQKGSSKQQQSSKKAGSSKAEKTCLRYNEGGCNNKSCHFMHRCIACDDLGHPKKDCKNVNKGKDKK